MTRTTVRRARKLHRCYNCGNAIKPGERYNEHVASPNDNNIGNVGGWWRIVECGHCAEWAGRPIAAKCFAATKAAIVSVDGWS